LVAQGPPEYLVNHGSAGEFGRFQALVPLVCRRGERVVVSSRRGLELGVVLCEATPRHQRVLQHTPVGQLLRLATGQDEQLALQVRQRGQQLFEDGCRLAAELGLPLEVLDVDVSLDGRQAEMQFLGPVDCDPSSLAAALARDHGLFVWLHNLAAPVAEEEQGCGAPNCGRAGGGSCTNCGSGGGCATGCGTGKEDVREYFAHLRAQMERRNLRPLL
jgi:hypothetical protein